MEVLDTRMEAPKSIIQGVARETSSVMVPMIFVEA